MFKVYKTLIGIFLIFLYFSPVKAIEEPNDLAQSGYADAVNLYKITEAAVLLAIDDS
jgi:hypothetical protein